MTSNKGVLTKVGALFYCGLGLQIEVVFDTRILGIRNG